MIFTAGVFLIRNDLKVLICHPTKVSRNFWSIPKGKIEKDESNSDAAIRETYEETNIDISNWTILHNLSPVVYPNGRKKLYGYVLFEWQNKIDFSKFELKCNSNVPEKLGGYPEIDDFAWETLENAKKFVHSSQIKCLEEIENIISRLKK